MGRGRKEHCWELMKAGFEDIKLTTSADKILPRILSVLFPNNETSSVRNVFLTFSGLFSVAAVENTVDKLIAITVIMVFKVFIISVLG